MPRSHLPGDTRVLLIATLWTMLSTAVAADQSVPYLPIKGGKFSSVLSGVGLQNQVNVKDFQLRRDPVTNQEFLAFLKRYPEWQKDRVPVLFADKSYLHQWPASDNYGNLPEQAAVTSVSWFAANAYCASENARLPAWYEWELAAAADETQPDARQNPEWRARILSWYAEPAASHPQKLSQSANYYGVTNMHGSIWEWVGDFNALLISPDSRTQGDPDKIQFCGAGAISLQNKENYAILMRVALLSSLSAASTTDSLGFRCARDSGQ